MTPMGALFEVAVLAKTPDHRGPQNAAK